MHLTAPAASPSLAGAWLRLGRVSNLPTVWTNVLAAASLAGGLPAGAAAEVLAAMSLFYVGGMFLNDACDRAIDARERPSRPIPSGRVAARTVFVAGFALLGVGLALMARQGPGALAAAASLAALIVAYDVHHKGFALSPLVMGGCRAALYVATAAAAGTGLAAPVLAGALAVFAHVVGLTYAARQESLDRIGALWPLAVLALAPVTALALAVTAGSSAMPAALLACLLLAGIDLSALRLLRDRARPGRVPAAVTRLIAAISLVDAALVAPVSPGLALVCVAGFGLTLVLQRVVPGT
ncbi:UbiA family prenyltransferase [Methylobacterium sp. SyP6R]|uniref:UbiA family prenyltransferase n=1 Tax=Methylobacterium sp. SyP6R TaxID=2718876 RepID=UPI001F37D385|nr:UbiA family prenyltransferase [Methylobacterium sp. SyP6R]MCF4129920.1 UbiA family prenyltransferase [Methylobacterium sp. SyP6R]